MEAPMPNGLFEDDQSRTDEQLVRAVHQELLERWNERNAQAMAWLFMTDGNAIGFDGSPLDGRARIESELTRVFNDHQTARYVGKVREVRFLTPEIVLVRAVAGMIPPGQHALNPNVNTVQSLVLVRQDGRWQIALYQNTPAAFHGRPEAARALTEELRALISQDGHKSG